MNQVGHATDIDDATPAEHRQQEAFDRQPDRDQRKRRNMPQQTGPGQAPLCGQEKAVEENESHRQHGSILLEKNRHGAADKGAAVEQPVPGRPIFRRRLPRPDVQIQGQEEKQRGQAGHTLNDVGHRLGLQGMGDKDQGATQSQQEAVVKNPIEQQENQAGSDQVNRNIDHMVADHISPAKVIIEGKGQIGEATAGK